MDGWREGVAVQMRLATQRDVKQLEMKLSPALLLLLSEITSASSALTLLVLEVPFISSKLCFTAETV